jgi:voltage-gated potassium channel
VSGRQSAGATTHPAALVESGSARRSARATYLAFIDRHEIAWELTFALLAVAYVIVGFAEESPAINATETLLTFVFVAEFVSRFGATDQRGAYLRGHWIDLLALMPTARGLRLLRLARLLRLVRAFAGLYRALSSVQALGQHRGLALLMVAWAAVMVICSLALYAAENGVNAAVGSPLDALWWGIVTLTTVGYGDITPVTGEGRLAASALMLLGIGLFSAITAIVTSFLLSDGAAARTPDARTPAARLRELELLRADGLVTADEYVAKRAGLIRDL